MFSSLGQRSISALQPLLLVNCRGKQKLHSFAWEISHSVTASFHFLFAVMLKPFQMFSFFFFFFRHNSSISISDENRCKVWSSSILKHMSVNTKQQGVCFMMSGESCERWENHSPLCRSGCACAGDHHQDGEADGGPGGTGRRRRLAREVEDKAHHALPPGRRTQQTHTPNSLFSPISI